MNIHIQNLLELFDLQESSKPLIEQALRHRSAISEHLDDKHIMSYERLEFLGDAVLDLAVSSFLFNSYPDIDEGTLSSMRSYLIRKESLSKIAKDINLDKAIIASKAAEAEGIRENSKILSDCLESIVGAAYIEAGYEKCSKVVCSWVVPLIEECEVIHDSIDTKGSLQKLTQITHGKVPEYETEFHGPPHRPTFTSNARINGDLLGTGTGRSKKEAESNAAKKALALLADLDKEKKLRNNI